MPLALEFTTLVLMRNRHRRKAGVLRTNNVRWTSAVISATTTIRHARRKRGSMDRDELVTKVVEIMCEKSVKAMLSPNAPRARKLMPPEQVEPVVREVMATLEELGALKVG